MEFRKIPPAGFQAYRKDLPVYRFQRRLPHWRQPGVTYVVTANLYDSLPAVALRELEQKRRELEQQVRSGVDDSVQKAQLRQLARLEERWLDAGHGACPFRQGSTRAILRELLHGHDAEAEAPRYHLGAWTIMPNHLHVLVRPYDTHPHALGRILQGWKGASARALNQLKDRQGPVWFQESYDQIIRDSRHLWRCLQYIGNNGALAGLDTEAYARWSNPEWEAAHWSFEP